MKITLGDRLKFREEEDKIIGRLRSAGRSLRDIEAFIHDFQKYVSASGVVEMHVFLSADEVRVDVAESKVLRQAIAFGRNRIIAKIERDGFCIGSATKSVARSQLRQTDARA